MFIHARAASHGNVNILNCHPFVAEGFMFMHNGGIANFSKIIRGEIIKTVGPRAASIFGATDTEYCFALFRHIIFDDALMHPGKTRICSVRHAGGGDRDNGGDLHRIFGKGARDL